MRIVFDDLVEFAQVAIRCNETVEKEQCEFCPFYDRCELDDLDSRHVLCAELRDNVSDVRGYNVKKDTPSLFECSRCGWSDSDTTTGDTTTYNYCPNCGLDVRGGN